MPRLIDADALMSRIEDSARNAGLHSEDYRKIKRFIAKAPTIDAEPVRHGRWEWYEDWGPYTRFESPELFDAYWICSACGTNLLQYLKSHFPDIPSYTECSEEVPPTLERCPSCGAKMDGGKDNDCA